MIVAVANHSLATGKTVIAQNLALLLARSGRKVVVLETGASHTNQHWSLEREQSGLRPVIEARSIDGRGVVQELEGLVGHVDDILLDTDARNTPESRVALVAAQVVVVPLAPEQADMSGDYPLIARLNAARMFNPALRVLFVATCSPIHCDLAAIRACAAQVMSASVADTIIDLSALRWGANVPGRCAVDLDDSAGSDAMKALFEEIYRRPASAGLINKRKNRMMKNVMFALVAALAVPVHAEEAKPDNETSFNAALTSDYRYRGISQTRLDPALQGGVDYTHNPSGFYAGTWLSTIKWIRDAGGRGDIEWDLYASRRGELGAGISYDIGALAYVYPTNGLNHVSGFANANTGEVYGQLGYGPAYAKYSLALTNLFGFVDSKHSGYLDLGANIPVSGGLKLNVHAGRQQVRNNGQSSYTDWKLGVSKDFPLVTCSLALVGTNASRVAYASPANGKFLGKNALVASISRTF